MEYGQTRTLAGENANTVSYSYSDYADVSFGYDAATGKYMKNAFGVPHMDADTNTQLAFDNVFVILAKSGIQEENGVLADIDLTEKTNEVTKAFLGQELAEAIFACPSSFGGYQKIDTETFFG